MYILTNAMKNLLRNKGRNILIAAVMLAIIISTVVTLTINNAAAKAIDEIRLDIGSKVEISQDLIGMHEAGISKEDTSYISIDDFMSYAESDYLSKVVYSANMYAWSDTFCAVGDDPANPGAATRTTDDGREVLLETCKVVSTDELDVLEDFGTLREIANGRMLEGINECIVSEEFAALNNISINDVIELNAIFATEKEYALTVVGIYSDTTEEYTNQMFASNERYADNRRNEIITSFETLMTAGWETNFGLDIKSAYYLKNPDDIAKFEQEVRSKGLPITYSVDINQEAYEKVSGPLAGMKSAVLTFMIVILILGAITLALISFMAVRERKYEIGVLRAMGMEKGKVAFGLLSEAVMIAVMCLVIGLGAGSAMAQPIASGILDGKVAEATEAASGPQKNIVLFAQGQLQTSDTAAGYEPESEIQVNLGADVITQIIIVTLCLAALSGVIGVTMITKYEPLKILRERN